MNTIADRVLSELAKVTESDEVRREPDLPLYELHILDSLRTVELIVALSELFGIEISPAELSIEEWQTPRKIVRYIEGKLGQ